MARQRTSKLAARFIAEAEADINYGLAENLDPRHEYERLVARLLGEVAPRPGSSAGRTDGGYELASPGDATFGHAADSAGEVAWR